MKTMTKLRGIDSKYEMDMVSRVADRAVNLAKSLGLGSKYDKFTAMMDLEICHANGTPLDWEKLLAATDGDFGHDVFGINRHLDHVSGKLTNCFSPRCHA